MKTLRILILEDRQDDVELMLDALNSSGLDFAHEVTSTRDDFLKGIMKNPDMILADYSLPHFTGAEALALLKESSLDIPLIMVTGSISEEAAVRCMKQGAADYILKDRLARLGEAIRNALREKELREQKRQAEIQLQERLHQQAMVAHIGDKGLASTDLPAFLEFSSKLVAQTLKVEQCALLELSQDKSFLFLRAGLGSQEGYVGAATIETVSDSQVGYTLRSFEPIIVEQFEREKRFSRPGFLEERRITSSVSVPVGEKNAPVGVLCAYTTQYHHFTHNDINFLQSVANIIGQVIQRNRHEDSLQQQAALINESQDAIWVHDLDAHVTFWNSSAERLYGWKNNEVMGRQVQDTVFQKNPNQFSEIMRVLSRDYIWRGEIRQSTKSGSDLITESRWTLTRTPQGLPRSILCVNTDITEKKKYEDHLSRSQRMDSLGILAGGIAHDINNLLSPILLSIPILKSFSPDDDFHEMLNTIDGSAKRAADIVQQLLTFSRGGKGKRITVRPDNLIGDMYKIIRETFSKQIQCEVKVTENVWPISADATQIHQVLMNLCLNAQHAMPHGGTLTLSVQNEMIHETDQRLAGRNMAPGPYIRIDVSDTGIGIPDAIKEKIFDPFFTTKDVGEGTGLGLSTSLGILKNHQGSIEVESEPGKGSTFTIHLPAHEPEKELDTPPEQPPPRGKGEVVLVVDDEIEVLNLVKRSLLNNGYEVLTAEDGTEAVTIIANRETKVDLVITDNMMPYLDGVSTIRALRKLRPDLKIIASTGQIDNKKISQYLTNQVQAFLPKPYTQDKLLKVVHEALYFS